MTQEILTGLYWSMAVTSGLMAGTYLAFSVVIMNSLAMLGTAKGIEAMNTINTVILRTAFMPLFFVSATMALLMMLTGLWFWGEPGSERAIIAGTVYVFGMFITTAAANVPLNNILASFSGREPEAVRMWESYLTRWTRWNSLRAIASIVTLVISIDLLSR